MTRDDIPEPASAEGLPSAGDAMGKRCTAKAAKKMGDGVRLAPHAGLPRVSCHSQSHAVKAKERHRLLPQELFCRRSAARDKKPMIAGITRFIA